MLGRSMLGGCLVALVTGCGGNVPIPDPKPVPKAAVPTAVKVRILPPLVVSPKDATLGPDDPGIQLVFAGEGEVPVDANWTSTPPGVVAVDARGYVRAVAPGEAVVAVKAGLATGLATIKVADRSGRPWDFGQDIVPILTRGGCNAGGCHGRKEGQNGFKLSFTGYDHEADFLAMTRDASGRRVSLLDPKSSLVLTKATGTAGHAGGPRLTATGDEAKTLLAWIAAGAPRVQGKSHGVLKSVAIEPRSLDLTGPGASQLRVEATYADGHRRDVTRLASYTSLDDSSASVDARGHVELKRRAEVDLVVRYQDKVVSLRVGTPINPGLVYDFKARPRANFIDDLLFKRLEGVKVPPSPTAGDAAFLRRVSLDLTGEQPSPEQVRHYLADRDPKKRTALVDRLLASRDFVRFWQLKFGDLLAITSARLGVGGASRYETWLAEKLAANTPYDAMVSELLSATGNPAAYEGGAANYALDSPDPKVQAELAAQRFLGQRIRCAQCHDHPFDIWTQDDYYGLAATFAKVQAGGMGKMAVRINPQGKVDHPRTGKPAVPRLLDGTPIEVPADHDPRKSLAAWMTDPKNTLFARASVNWTWSQFFGKGIVDPPDDMSRSNPAVHPELLDALAAHFIGHKYDLRDLARTIATSEAYALSSATVAGNEHDSRFFSHQMPRPLTAHQMADAIAQATGVPNQFADQTSARRAIEIVDPARPSTILDAFGRCGRTNGCASVATPSLSLRQSLLLIGGDVIESKITNLGGYLTHMLELAPEPDEVVENLYKRTVCRAPTDKERDHWAAELKKDPSMREAAEDLFWSLLNSREFAFNH
jgi:hypothetical protein